MRIQSTILLLSLSLVGFYPARVEAQSPSIKKLDQSLRAGVDFLIENQNSDGSWGTPKRTKGLNIFAPVPGAHHAFRAGTTGLCIASLVELSQLKDREAQIEKALRKSEEWLQNELPKLRRATPQAIYNVWGHAYCIQALTRLIELRSKDHKKVEVFKDLIRGQVDRLSRYELVNGGWGYYDFDFGTQKPAGSPTCFTTATVLIALKEAQEVGIEIPKRLVRRAVTSIKRQRKPDFSYVYGEYLLSRPMRLVNRHGGSLGRTQACNAALRAWGDTKITDKVQQVCVKRLLDRDLWLDIGRKRPIPHESWFQVAGYFYYYGFYYGAYTLKQIDPKLRKPLGDRLAKTILKLQEKDGSWWDYPLYSYHQPYGTGYALMILTECRKAMGKAF